MAVASVKINYLRRFELVQMLVLEGADINSYNHVWLKILVFFYFDVNFFLFRKVNPSSSAYVQKVLIHGIWKQQSSRNFFLKMRVSR